MNVSMVFYAHSHPGERTPGNKWQRLCEHLVNAAGLARQLAEETRPGDDAFAHAAYLAGLLHDLGKYRREFQDYIRHERSRGQSTRHKQVGAAHAHAAIGGRSDLPFAIAGHHGGLCTPAHVKDLILGPHGKALAEKLWPTAAKDCPALADTQQSMEPPPGIATELQFDLHVRLLFSCLVDADWLDTAQWRQKHAQGDNVRPPADVDLHPAERLADVLDYIEQCAADCKNDEMAAIRKEVLEAALHAAERSAGPGLFSMTVPTGGGKTLSALAFALKHASKHGLRRIIYVAPYLSIIEQNAQVLRSALKAEQYPGLVLEHHSLTEPAGRDEEEHGFSTASLLAENWDTPVVITTSVQFFESLFANAPRRCRKLHNIARSVVILDECQTLPPGLTAPTCQMLEQFSEAAGCSIVLCTATQPAWHRRDDLPEGLRNVEEIVPSDLRLFDRLRRVHVRWPKERQDRWGWEEAAGEMLQRDAALCVVNTKRKARDLFQQLRSRGADGLFHLSTSMCPAHRLMVIGQVKQRLKEGKACRLVSTQLIEAGVDLDFPFAMREMAPLESIVQAAGRCNREGRLNRPDGTPGGEVVVFRSVDPGMPPDLWYRNGIDTVEQSFLAQARQPDLSQPGDLQEYFRRLYRSGSLDRHDIQAARRRLDFPYVAEKYRLIDETATTSVVVTTWDPARDTVGDLLARLQENPSRNRYRALARYQVNLLDRDIHTLKCATQPLTGVQIYCGPYDNHLGVVADAPGSSWIV